MRFKKIFALLCAVSVLCGSLQSDIFAAKANRGQFTPAPTAQAPTVSQNAGQLMPETSPASYAQYYSSYAPATRTATSTGTGIKIGNTSYKSLQDAVDSVKNGQTIQVTKNISLSKAVGCNREIKFTIDFHNNQLKMPGKDNALFVKKGTVSLKRMKLTGSAIYNSIYIGPEASVVIVSGNYNGQIGVYGSLTVKGGVLAGEKKYATILNSRSGKTNIQGGTIQNKGPYSAVIFNLGTLNITKGTISTVHKAGGGVHFASIQNGGNLSVSGGTIKGNKAVRAISNGEYGDGNGFYTGQCSISGGTISGGVVNHSGSTIISNGQIKDSYSAVDCYGGNVAITGGNISSTESPCVYVEGGSADVRGGKFKGVQKEGGLVGICKAGTLNISGGTFIGSDLWVFEYGGGTINLSGSASEITIYVP